MESKNEYLKNETPENEDSAQEGNELEFENPSVDPGFGDELKGLEDERSGNIDSNQNISEMQKDKGNKENDAMNYKNDRENGAYNPKNI